jgi:multiple sugar transport system permease protein
LPGLIATGVLSFIFSWNEFTIALNLTSQTNATVPVVVAKFANDYEVQHFADGGRVDPRDACRRCC